MAFSTAIEGVLKLFCAIVVDEMKYSTVERTNGRTKMVETRDKGFCNFWQADHVIV
jgi:hypothetical protein